MQDENLDIESFIYLTSASRKIGWAVCACIADVSAASAATVCAPARASGHQFNYTSRVDNPPCAANSW